MANAEKCDALLQLDPLDEIDREDYLCLSLRVTRVPLSVSIWVSEVANGNPQYIEICANLIDKYDPPIIERKADSAIEQSTSEIKDAEGDGWEANESQTDRPDSGGSTAMSHKRGKGANNGVVAVLVPDGGAERLKSLAKPSKIMGYIKQTIG